MEPIDPHHSCWWTSQRQTELRLSEGSFRAAGVSLPVIMAAFAEENLAWLTRIYGDHDDNCVVMGVPHEFAQGRMLERHSDDSSSAILPRSILPPLAEFALDEGLEEEIRADGLAVFEILIHDDCFVSVSPETAETILRLVSVVLRQHSFYLGVAVDWSGVTPEIVRLMEATERVRLVSAPKGQQLLIYTDRDSPYPILGRWFSAGKPSLTVSTVGGMAILIPAGEGA